MEVGSSTATLCFSDGMPPVPADSQLPSAILRTSQPSTYSPRLLPESELTGVATFAWIVADWPGSSLGIGVASWLPPVVTSVPSGSFQV